MAANDYHFITHWRVRADIDSVSGLLGDPTDLPRWWPDVYLSAREIEPAGAGGVGRVVALHTKGWLPYTLRWNLTVTENRSPYGFAIRADGDFVGRGVWTFVSDGPDVDIAFDWKLVAEKPLLRRLSFLLRPLFAWNHRWAMARGLESLVRELGRRHPEAPPAARPAPARGAPTVGPVPSQRASQPSTSPYQ